MTREEIILSAPKKQGLRVYVLDHCDKKALIEKYRRHEVNIENIEEVDFVGGNSGRIFSYGSEQSAAGLPGTRRKKVNSSLCIHWSKRNRRSAMWASAGVISMSTNGVSHQLHFD